MRLVKKTVNQDDVSAYHLFYGDELGNPGTEFTFFDWPHLRVAPNHAGAGEVSATELRVAERDALAYWTQRLDDFGVPHAGIEEREGRSFVAFRDPEGQRLRLSDDSGSNVAPGTPWDGNSVPVEFGVRGLGTFDLAAREVGPGGAGARVRLIEKPDAPAAHLGRGGVHHVAFRVPDDEQHGAWRKHLRASGIGVTPRIDRFYFRAIYFREPGGILFEISTDGPGFATDEDAAHLGERLSLPPFLEDRREEIEGRLTPIG
jgi:glyoxalase family protein